MLRHLVCIAHKFYSIFHLNNVIILSAVTYYLVNSEFQGNATKSRLMEIFNMGMLHTAAIYKVINYEQLLFKALIKIIVINVT